MRLFVKWGKNMNEKKWEVEPSCDLGVISDWFSTGGSRCPYISCACESHVFLYCGLGAPKQMEHYHLFTSCAICGMGIVPSTS
jgi:hypothetical protein